MNNQAPNEVSRLAQRMSYLKDVIEYLENNIKLLNSELKEIKEYQLPKMMEDANIEKVSISHIGTLYLRHDVFTSINAENKEKVYEWFRNHGASTLIVEHIHPQTLKAWVKETLENGGEIPMEISYHIKQTAAIRSTKGR